MSVLELSAVGWTPKSTGREEASPILSDVDFRVEAGEWVVLTGPSGSGKTTLLSLAAGLLKPSQGSVELLGENLARISDDRLAELRAGSLGLIFQGFHLDDSRTTGDNILLPAYFSNRPWFELRERAGELATQLGLGDHLHKDVSVLSGGQRQRVAVARSLLLKPKFILADEPTGALDRPTANLVLDLLEKEKERGTALLTVTHDTALQERADRIFSLRDGRLMEGAEAA